MSYGMDYIESDTRKLKRYGLTKNQIVKIISRRINWRYPDIPISRGETIAKKTYEGRETSVRDWAHGSGRTSRVKDSEIRAHRTMYGLSEP